MENIIHALSGIRLKKRPEELYLRLTKEVLSDLLKTEQAQKKFLQWLEVAVLPSFGGVYDIREEISEALQEAEFEVYFGIKKKKWEELYDRHFLRRLRVKL